MAYDEGLAQRIREELGERDDLAEKKMFGGIAFMVSGHMCVGVVGERLMVRVGPEAHDEAVSQPHASIMDFSGRSSRGFVYVDPPGLESDEELAAWIDRGLAFVGTLPPK